MLCGIEEQVSRANQYRESQLKVKVQVETEVSTSANPVNVTRSSSAALILSFWLLLVFPLLPFFLCLTAFFMPFYH